MKNILMTALAAAFLTVGAFAQKSEVGRRAENQQDRIAQGVKSGSLKPGETAHLESKEAGINREIRADRRTNGGKLSPAEKRAVNRQQNHVSRQIYRKKHN